MNPTPPQNETILIRRAVNLSGKTLGAIAAQHGTQCPPDLKRHKGWVGQLIEWILGASAGSRAEPDFPQLGIELKTIPVDETGKPRESTYVCVAPLDGSMATRWEESWVCRKLAKVLWIPIITDPETPLADRRIAAPKLWCPNTREAHLLQSDWEGLAELIATGSIWQMDAFKGEVLQLRPKGANKNDLVWAIDEEGQWVQTVPRGFYLRPSFTRTLLATQFPTEP